MKKILKSLLFCSIASTAYSKFMDVEVATSMTPRSSAKSIVRSNNLKKAENISGVALRRNPILDSNIGFAFRVSTNFYVTERSLFGVTIGYQLDNSIPHLSFKGEQLSKEDLRLHFFPIMANYRFGFFSKENINFYITLRGGIAFGGLLKEADNTIRKDAMSLAKKVTDNRKTSSISKIMEAGLGCEVSGFQAEVGYRLMLIDLLTADLIDFSGKSLSEILDGDLDSSDKSPFLFHLRSHSFYVSVGYRLTF